jgi:hypothetical protein
MSAAVMRRVLKLPPQDGEVSKKKTHADQTNSNTSQSLTPSNENSVLDFALLIITIIPTTIDASASPKITTMSIVAH